MDSRPADILRKLKWSWPWLIRYPFWRARKPVLRENGRNGLTHVVFMIANHFEPGVGKEAIDPVDRWCKLAIRTGRSLRDHDGTPFRHTYFFPAEQYDYASIEKLATLRREGLGEVEIHLHHGVQQPDNAVNTRRLLATFRDTLAFKHGFLSRENSNS